MNKPQDFDQYWKKVDDELASIQPAAERTELHLRSALEAKVYGLKLTSLDHYRIFAYFCVLPKRPVPCHLQIAELRKCCSHPSFRRTMQIHLSSIVPPWTTSFGSTVCSKISDCSLLESIHNETIFTAASWQTV